MPVVRLALLRGPGQLLRCTMHDADSMVMVCHLLSRHRLHGETRHTCFCQPLTTNTSREYLSLVLKTCASQMFKLKSPCKSHISTLERQQVSVRRPLASGSMLSAPVPLKAC